MPEQASASEDPLARRSTLAHEVQQDLGWLGISIIVIGILLKVLFSESSMTTLAKLIGGIIWLFVLPGYCIMLPWKDALELKERVVVGMLAAAALLAIASYYAGLAGVHVRSHAWLFPPIVIACAFVLGRLRGKRFMKPPLAEGGG